MCLVPPLLYAVQYSCNFLDHCVLLTLCYKSSFQRNNALAFYSEVRCTVVMNWQLHTKSGKQNETLQSVRFQIGSDVNEILRSLSEHVDAFLLHTCKKSMTVQHISK